MQKPAGTIPLQLDPAGVEGGKSAPMSANVVEVTDQGQSQRGLKLVMQHRAASHAFRINFDAVDGNQYNTLQFKVHVDTATGDPSSFGIWILNKKGEWAATSFLKHATDLGDGWYQFSWDMVNQPDNRLIDLSELNQIRIRYGFEGVPEGKTDVLTLIDMKFVSGLSVKTGDPELYQQWRKYIAAYKPDYRDSSKDLLPPETGRIATPLPLTVNGKAVSKIIVPQDASEPLRLAGSELQHWLREISGAEIAIIATPDGGNDTHILLGRNFAMGKYDQDIATLADTDGFAVRTDDKNIYIFGATDKGTLNGVFVFLGNNTDVIWPRPQPELSAVFTSTPSLNVLWGNALEKPATLLRGWATNLGLRPETEIWETRNRVNYPKGGGGVALDATRRMAQGNYVEYGGGHNLSGFLGKNPDFYPEIDGAKVTTFNIWKHQPNFTAPGIVDAVASNAVAYIQKKAPPHIDTININIEDNWGVSTDSKSLAPIPLPDGTLLNSDDPAFRSTQFFIFLNAVAEKIHVVYPDLMVGTYAYFFTATAPKIPIHPNIRVYFAPYVRKDYRSPLSAPINAHWWTQLTAFAKMTPRVVIREYYGIMNGGRPLAEVVGFDVKSYLPLGVKEYTAEMFPDEEMIWSDGAYRSGRQEWDFMAMDFWVINRLYWNPDQNVEQLRKYYLRRTFHEAASAMEMSFGILRENWYKSLNESSFEDPEGVMSRFVIQPGDEAQMRQLLMDAHEAAGHAVSRMSVDVLAKTFDRWLALSKATPDQKKALTQRTTEQVLQLGWGSNTDWGTSSSWASSTVINRDDKTIPAIRVTVRGDRANGNEVKIANAFLAGLPGQQKGDTLSFAMVPGVLPETVRPLQLVLTATDRNGVEITAPAEAFNTLSNGGLNVRWKLASADDTFDSTQIKKMTITIPNEVFGVTPELTYYITDWSLGQARE